MRLHIFKVIICLMLLQLVYISFSYGKVVKGQGYACDPNIEIAKEKALKRARKSAVEEYVGILVDSRDLVINGKLMRETIQTMALGKAHLVGSPEYEVKSYPNKGIVCVNVTANFDVKKEDFYKSNFHLKLVLNKNEFHPGEELKVWLYSKKRCYPYLFSVDARGRVFRLLPNHIEKSPVLEGKLEFPTAKMRYIGITIAIFPDPELKQKSQIEELFFVCTKKREKSLEDLFPEAFVQNSKHLKRLLNRPFLLKVSQLAQVLEQIGLSNYEMVDTFYRIESK